MDVVTLRSNCGRLRAGYTARRRVVLVQGPPPRQAEGRRVYTGAATTSSAAEKTREFVEIEE